MCKIEITHVPSCQQMKGFDARERRTLEQATYGATKLTLKFDRSLTDHAPGVRMACVHGYLNNIGRVKPGITACAWSLGPNERLNRNNMIPWTTHPLRYTLINNHSA
jgi:hypothetical protein